MKNPFMLKNFLEKDLRVDNKKTLEFEESFLDDSDYETPGIETPISGKKIFFLATIVFLALGFLFFRTSYLQIIKGKEFRGLAQENRIFSRIIISPRGIIFDRNSRPLLKNIPSLDIIAVPTNLPSDKESLKKEIRLLSQVIQENEEKIEELLSPITSLIFTPILLKENISHDMLLDLESNKPSLPGIEIQERSRREYIEGGFLSHVLGYSGPLTKKEWEDLGKNCKGKDCYLLSDVIGKTGIEASYEKELRGYHGEERFEIDSSGEIQKSLGTKKAVPGNNLVLTIDLEFQKKILEILTEQLKDKNPAAVIAMNPQNGAVLALVSSPTYDNNLFAKGISNEDYNNLINNEKKPLFDRAISGAYPPGSTIKPLMATAALKEGVITKDTVINSTGGVKTGKWFFKDWKEGGHGPTNVIKAISESVNSYFYTVIGGTEEEKGVGIEKTEKYLRLFGLGEKTGIDIPGEKEGLIPDPKWKKRIKKEEWYIGDTYNLAIGQGDLLVTPIQVASYMGAIANGGNLYQPRIVSEIVNSEGKVTTYQKEIIIRNSFMPKEILNLVREGMRAAVITGPARTLNDLNISVAGKTGTAEIGKEDKYHSWFSCFAPYENPEIVLVVLVEEGEGGEKTSLPIAKEILRWYFKK